jgi:hypothetical protein
LFGRSIQYGNMSKRPRWRLNAAAAALAEQLHGGNRVSSGVHR